LYDGGVKDGRINVNRFVQLMATAPAKMFGMFPRKGTIAVGSDADIVIFDPQVTGKVQKVFLRGELIVDGDNWLGHAGMGRYLRRSASGRIL
jgi:dihydropyrimidinase